MFGVFDWFCTGFHLYFSIDFLTAFISRCRWKSNEPKITSGLRFGTAAATSRGFNESDFELVGESGFSYRVFNEEPNYDGQSSKNLSFYRGIHEYRTLSHIHKYFQHYIEIGIDA